MAPCGSTAFRAVTRIRNALLRLQLAALSHVIYHLYRWDTKGEHCFFTNVCNSEVTLVDDTHTNNDVSSTCKDTFCNADTVEYYLIWQPDIH